MFIKCYDCRSQHSVVFRMGDLFYTDAEPPASNVSLDQNLVFGL